MTKPIKINKAFNFWYEILDRLESKKECLLELDLTGSRWSGKTISIMLFCVFVMSKKLNANIVFVRYEPQGAAESWEEFLGVCDMLNIDISNKGGFNQTKKEWRHNGNRIKFLGFRSNIKKAVPKLGIARGINRQTTIRIIDEITEFPHHNLITLIDQSIGGAKQMIKIQASNPWNISHWYIAGVNEFHAYNKKKMKEKGQSIKSVWLNDKHFKLSSQTNHRVNSYLSEIQHQELINLWNIDPFQAVVADLGIPGVVRGNIYAKLLHKIRNPQEISRLQPGIIYEGGIDWGESDNLGGSATALIFGRADRNNQWESVDFEYYHKNSNSPVIKTQNTLIREVIECLVKNILTLYDLDHIKTRARVILIYVDNAAVGIPSLLQAELLRQNFQLSKLIRFKYCTKYKRDERVKVMKYVLGSGSFFMDPVSCPNLYRELNNALYDEDKLPEEEVPIKENDDTLDALDYKHCKRTRSITKNRTYSIIYKKRLNIWS